MTSRNGHLYSATGRFFLSALLLIFIFSIAAAVPPSVSADGCGPTERGLDRSLGFIRADEANRRNMQRAIGLLQDCLEKSPKDIRILLALAEAWYRAADPDADIDAIYPYVEKAGGYAARALGIAPDSMEAHYWHGLFLLRKAQKVSILRAYSVAKQGIRELELVRKYRPDYDYGGASRTLGLLYEKAPGWSPFGDREKALNLAKEATRISPDYLLNRVYLAEAYAARGDKSAAIAQWQKILAASSAAPDQTGGNRFRKTAREKLRELG